MSESELFAHPMQELALGENLAVGYKVPVMSSEKNNPSPFNFPSIRVIRTTV
jgi:hypothetical protein